ncbi:MAG: hypothetical protein J0I41_11710 [Filimonas sp.]|nr:hypothetical protein [Filimonas sp.]
MMRKVTLVLITGFLICVIAFIYHAIQFVHSGTHYSILSIQFAPRSRIDVILQEWNRLHLLPLVVYNTTLDFFFIIFYVFLLVLYSHRRAQLEQNRLLRSILKMNVWIAVLAGILDGIENGIVLRNIQEFATNPYYESARSISILKFMLIGWVILVWIASRIASAGRINAVS